MSADTGVCWCASEGRCPHKIQDKISGQWNEMEKAIDDILSQFDRRSIKKFLKRDPDGLERPTTSADNFREVYGADLQKIVSKTAQGDPLEERRGKAIVHPLSMNNRRPGTAPDGSGPVQLPPTEPSSKKGKKTKKHKPLDPGMTKPLELAEGEFVGSMTTNKAGYARRPHTSQAGSSNMSKSMSALPHINGAERLPDGDAERARTAQAAGRAT